MKDIGCDEVLLEISLIIVVNVFEKVWYVYKNYKIDCFFEDIGLEVDVLNGELGVYFVCYVGFVYDDEVNMSLLFVNMKGEEDCKVCFYIVISFIIDGKEY